MLGLGGGERKAFLNWAMLNWVGREAWGAAQLIRDKNDRWLVSS